MMDALAGWIERITGIFQTCVFHYLTGLYCPGCGGTRAVLSFLRGDWRMSVQYHPLILYVAAVLCLEAGSWVLARLLHRPGLYVRRYEGFVLLGAVIVVVNWIFKNYMLIWRGVDLLPLL